MNPNTLWRSITVTVSVICMAVCILQLVLVAFAFDEDDKWLVASYFGAYPSIFGKKSHGTHFMIYTLSPSEVLMVITTLIEFYAAVQLLSSTDKERIEHYLRDSQSKLKIWLSVTCTILFLELIAASRLLQAGNKLYSSGRNFAMGLDIEDEYEVVHKMWTSLVISVGKSLIFLTLVAPFCLQTFGYLSFDTVAVSPSSRMDTKTLV